MDGFALGYDGFDPEQEGLRLSFAMPFHGAQLRVSLVAHRLTIGVAPEGIRRPINVGVGDEVRELRGEDETAFDVNHDRFSLTRAGG